PVIYKNASFHCVQAAHPQLELALRRIFIDYRGGGFCVFQSYKSVEKNWGMGTEEIGSLCGHPFRSTNQKLIFWGGRIFSVY
uniref:hypothetical protein n=2 Tax=Anaerobutyricum hallii TaxID=39488 RepID=UPI003A89D6CB